MQIGEGKTFEKPRAFVKRYKISQSYDVSAFGGAAKLIMLAYFYAHHRTNHV